MLTVIFLVIIGVCMFGMCAPVLLSFALNCMECFCCGCGGILKQLCLLCFCGLNHGKNKNIKKSNDSDDISVERMLIEELREILRDKKKSRKRKMAKKYTHDEE